MNQIVAARRVASDVLRRSKNSLACRLGDLCPGVKWISGFRGYVEDLEDNLLTTVTPDLYRHELLQGAGGELHWTTRNGKRCPPKMQAAHSSAALVVNAFAPWKRHPRELELVRQSGFTCLQLEVKVPSPLGGTPPHLDAVADGSQLVVAIESKATEYLQAHRASFAASYDTVNWPNCIEPYLSIKKKLQSDPLFFVYLDAAQLIKHTCGLSNVFQGQEVVLLYLFWEPANYKDFGEFAKHRDELDRFAQLSAGSGIKFVWKSYLDLWNDWTNLSPEWARAHAASLLERYAVEI